MKFHILVLAIAALALSACEKKSGVGESINDALDRRPHENLKDAGEDIKDAVHDATR
jgi:predicted small secreted protein